MNDTVKTPTTLVVADRCDFCSAQALVLLTGKSGSLQFCGHHHDRFAEKLGSQSFIVTYDARNEMQR